MRRRTSHLIIALLLGAGVLAAQPAITTTSPLTDGGLGFPYNLPLAAQGGTQPYFWSLITGSLPMGLGMSQQGVISGTPTSAGTSNFTVQVKDLDSLASSQQFSLTIMAGAGNLFTITTPSPLPQAQFGVAYSQTLAATGAPTPYTWSIVTGSLPIGLTLSTGGVITGTPTSAGQWGFTVQVVGTGEAIGGPPTASQAFSLTVNPPPVLFTTPPFLPDGVAGAALTRTIQATGGLPPYTWTITSGALPAGVTLGLTTGVLSGTPTTTGKYTFTVQAMDTARTTVSGLFSITIDPALTITSAAQMPGGTAGVAYFQTLTSSGGTAPVTWSILSGSLPTGLTLSGAGVLSGTPTSPAVWIFTVMASGAAGDTATARLVLGIAQPLAIAPAAPAGGNAGVSYQQGLAATGGRPPYSWSLVSGSLPPGLNLSSTGTLSGTPSTAGTFPFTVQVSDAAQVTASSALSVTIAPQLVITTTTPLAGATVSSPYTRFLTGTGGTPPYVWSISAGALPAGLSLNGSSGVITGAPGAAGTFSFTAQIKDSLGITASAPLSLTVTPPLAIGAASPLAAGVTGTAYSQNLAASGGTPPYRWIVQAGALPGGLTLDGASGVIGGRPSAPGRFGFTAQVQDSGGLTVSKAFALTVSETLAVSPAALMFHGAQASQSLQATCSTVAARLSISSSAPWLVVSPSNGTSPATITVAADPRGLAAGSYQGSVSIASSGANQTVGVTLTVDPSVQAVSRVSPSSLNFAYALGAGASSQSVTVSGAAYTTSVSSGAGWLSVSPPGGDSLAVTANPVAMAAGTYTGTIEFDDGSSTASVAVTMSITSSSDNLALSQSGLTFTTVAGATGSQSRSIGVLNSGTGAMSWTASSTTLSGGPLWLTLAPSTGVAGAQAAASSLTVSVSAAGLTAGQYYGQVTVSAPTAGNPPQLVSVVLNVLPADKSPGAQIYPSGLLFTGVAGGANPDARTITLTNVDAAPASYTSSVLTDDGANWISATPGAGSVPGSASASLAIQPKIAGLAPGVWQGTVTLRFGDGSVRNVSVALVLRASQTARSPKERAAVTGCNPSKLVPLFTSIGANFSVPAAWPSALELAIVDDCGEPLTAGSVVATFSTGDAPLALTALREGNWSGTWTPRGISTSGVILTAQARNAGANLQGSARLVGGVLSNPYPPVINTGGIVSTASFVGQAPLAPGSLITILGSHLADGMVAADSLPLPTQLGQTQVLIGAQPAPLLFVSDGQIGAIAPYDLAVNTQHQVTVQRGTSYTTPEPVTFATAGPSVFTRDQSGKGQGLVMDANFQYVDASNPAAVGDKIVIYATGLGEVVPPLPAGTPAPFDVLYPTASRATVTIGGVDAPLVLFAGLAPGFTGLYQVNVVVPDGVAPGDAVPISITVANLTGPPVTFAVR